jgi:hypothetical protein
MTADKGAQRWHTARGRSSSNALMDAPVPLWRMTARADIACMFCTCQGTADAKLAIQGAGDHEPVQRTEASPAPPPGLATG